MIHCFLALFKCISHASCWALPPGRQFIFLELVQSACVCCSSSRQHGTVLDRCTSTFTVNTFVIVCLWIIVYGFTLCYILILLQLAFWHLQAVDLTLSSKSLEGGPHSHSCSLCQSCASEEVKRNQLTRSLLVIQEIWTFFLWAWSCLLFN